MKNANIADYNEKEHFYLETYAFSVGLAASPLQVRENVISKK